MMKLHNAREGEVEVKVTDTISEGNITEIIPTQGTELVSEKGIGENK